jgi:hypothetical protein
MNITKVTASIISTAALFSASIAYAGDMGSKLAPLSVPYVGGEVSASWIQKNAPHVNGVTANISEQNWGGRLSAGMLRFHTEKLALMGEIGGGYYGSRSVTIPQLSASSKLEVDGYDVLVGALYKLKHVDVFGQVGFMIENARMSLTKQDLNKLAQGDFIHGSSSVRFNTTQVLPEVRAGGVYNVRDDLGVTLAYMHAFGSTPDFSGVKTATRADGINTVVSAKLQNPSLNAVLLGLHYYIV